jgi:hypothetical protein
MRWSAPVPPATDPRDERAPFIYRSYRSLPAIETAAVAFTDLVCSYDALEHLPNDQVAPNAGIVGPLFFAYEYQHTRVRPLERVETMLRDVGFTVERSGSFLFRVHKNLCDHLATVACKPAE